MDQSLPNSTIANSELKEPSQTFQVKKIILIIGVVLLIVAALGVAYFFLIARPKPPESVIPPAIPIKGASFILTAEPIEATLGGQVRVTVSVKSDADPANLFVAKLKFPKQLLVAKSIDLRSEATASGFIKNWFISNWVENTIDNNSGSVSLVGGVPNPGFQSPGGSSGSAMADIIFIPKSPGEAKITFDDTSTIYRNSDNRNILISKQDVTVKIMEGALVASAAATPTPSLSSTPTPTLSPVISLEGDINQDGKVDFLDMSILLSDWGKTASAARADLNSDGIINAFDYSKLTKILKDAGLVQ